MSLLPKQSEDMLMIDVEFGEEQLPPLKTYGISENKISGMIDGIAAIKQMIHKIISTERFQYIIYNFDYGIEIIDLIGKETEYVMADLKRRFEEALLQNNHIRSIEDFEIETYTNETITVNFVTNTTQGEIKVKEVIDIVKSKNIRTDNE